MRMHRDLLDPVKSAFRDQPRRHLIRFLLAAGVVLIAVGAVAAGRIHSLPRQAPCIEALIVNADRHEHCYLRADGEGYKVGRAQKYDIQCVVAGGDSQLSFQWLCRDGEFSEISEDGSMITWTAPDSSVDNTIVTVIVSDTADQTVSANMSLHVVSCSVCTFGPCPG